MDPLKAKANFTRICQLLVDRGGNALRAALHAKHPPSTLAAALNANKMTLQKIRHTVIKLQQWTLLFPASGTPDSNNFDISLLTIILQNICGLRSPAAGWDIMPPASDTSISADILRIKMYRNRVYGHIPTAQYDDTTFEKLWQEISKSLIKLGIPQEDIDELKLDPLSPEAESYIEKLKEWKELEDDMLLKLNDLERGVLKVENKVLKLQRIVENPVPSQVDQLAKFDFTGEIDDLCKKCQNGTRQWFFDMLLNWSNHENSRVMILSTDPDVGENVLFAKVCKLYKQRGQLAACHTYDFGNSDHSSPYRILQSLASQMCENVDGFRDTLTEVLRREHSRDSLSDAFRVLLSDPLHDLCRRDPLLIVLDASNKKKPDVECEFLEMIFDEFLELPKCVKVLAWSKAGLNARKKLLHLQSEHLAQCCLLNAGLCSLNSKLIPVHSDKFGSTIALDKPRSSITVFGFIGRLVNKVEEHYIFNAIPISNVGPNAPTSMQQATYKEALKVADQVSSSELLHCISEAKVIFEETLHSLDLFENYLKSPSEETAKPLKLLFDCGQSAYDEIFTTGTIGNFLEFVRTFLINKCSQDAEDEGKRSQHFDQKSSNSVNRNLDNDIGLDSQPNSILEEASQLDLKNEKSSPLLPNFENNEKKLESEKCSKVVNVASQTPVNAPGKFEDSFVQLSLNPKAKLERDSGNNSTTQIKDCVSSKEDYSIGEIRNKDKSKKKPEREISKDSSMIDHVLPQLKQGKQGKGIDGYVKYSGAEKKKKSEKMLKSLENEENALKSRSFIQFPEPPAVMLSLRVKELEEENLFLESQMKSLQAKYEESLAELGQIAVQKTAKENEERKSELFQQIFRSPLSEATALPTSKDRPINDMNVNGSLNRFLKPQTTQERADAPSVIYPAAFSEQPVEGAEALVQRGNHQPGKEEMVTSDKDESEIQRGDRRSTEVATFRNNNENQTPSTQNSLSNTSREKTNGGEEINKSGKIHETSDLASTSRKGYENLSFSVQQDDSGTDYISLGNVPPTSVATTLYNNYKLLLLSLAQRLLSCDVVQLRNWATQNFSISDPQNATDILFQLDRKGVINASDLSQLYHFFESIVRIDLVYIIDAFLLGDYSLLRQTSAPKKQGANAAQTPQYRTTTMYQSMFNAINTSRQSLVNSATSSTLRTSAVRNPATLGKPENNNGAQIYLPKPTQQAAFRNSSDATNPTHVSRSPNENLSTASEQQNLKPAATGFTPTRMADVVVADGSSVANERRTMAGNSLTRTNPSVTNNARNTQAVGSNGSKHSKFQRSEIERSNMSNFQPPGGSRNQYLDREGNWLCSHYKRHCYVKFECCNNFWPCHRCHNNQSTCGRKKLKSRDTEMLKCAYCNKVQQFGHSCCDCGAKFAEYYCGLCKHLTAKDDNPYHCEKCGICRIHGDRSFHCDICGVCLDVQLRGNHKCREDSAHDECCICLEDAFTGCQILPCSHKVHKECATQMIRSGITRCPICRESFAHKLERRPPPISRNRPGK